MIIAFICQIGLGAYIKKRLQTLQQILDDINNF